MHLKKSLSVLYTLNKFYQEFFIEESVLLGVILSMLTTNSMIAPFFLFKAVFKAKSKSLVFSTFENENPYDLDKRAKLGFIISVAFTRLGKLFS